MTGREGARGLGRTEIFSGAASSPLDEVILSVLHHIVDAWTEFPFALRLQGGCEFGLNRFEEGDLGLLHGRRGLALRFADPVGHAFAAEAKTAGGGATLCLKRKESFRS